MRITGRQPAAQQDFEIEEKPSQIKNSGRTLAMFWWRMTSPQTIKRLLDSFVLWFLLVSHFTFLHFFPGEDLKGAKSRCGI